MDALTTAYFVCFVAGAGFCLVSWLLGAVGSHGHSDTPQVDAQSAGAGGDVHVEGSLDAHGDHGVASPDHAATSDHGPGHEAHGLVSAVLLPVANLSSWAAFSCVGGAAGLVARRAGAGPLPSLVIALPAGLAAAYAIGGLLTWLRKESRFKRKVRLEGMLVTVLVSLSSEKVGEVLYNVDGARSSLPARGTTSALLAPGTEVVILEVTDGIARVTPAAEFLGVKELEPRRNQVNVVAQKDKEGRS